MGAPVHAAHAYVRAAGASAARGLFLGGEESKLFDPPLIAAVLILVLIAVGALALAALVERLDPQPPKRWTLNHQLVVAGVAVLGLTVMLRNLAELT